MQTDGQTEIVNQHITNQLRPFVNYHQDNWGGLLLMMDFAAAALPSETTGLSPFLIDCGYEPQTSFDWKTVMATSPNEHLSMEKAQENVEIMENIWDMAKRPIHQQQETHKQAANNYHQEVDFDVGDRVWLSLKHYQTD